MGDIYTTASYTAIWLGQESDEVKMAFDLLRKFSMAWNSLECDPPGLNDPDFISRNRTEKTLRAAFGEDRTTAFQRIWALLNRPWFTRKWVIQELVKSRRPIMVTSRIGLPWTLLADWMNFVERCLNVKEHFMRLCPQPVESDAKLLGMGMFRATLLTRIAVSEKQLLLFLIVKTLEFRCADPRDHVFAMLGIASDADRFDLIDYESPIENVYRKLAYACISDSMNLKLLWSLIYLAPLKRRDGSILASQFSVQQYRDYNASGDTVLQTQLENSGNMLMIRGRIVDRLKLLGSESRSLGDARILTNMVNRNVHLFRNNLQRMQRQRCEWLEECLAIAKTTNIINDEEAFQNAMLGDFLVNKEVQQSLEVARSEFSTQRRLYKAMAYENEHGRWLTAMIASTSLKSSHLLDSMIMEKLHRRFGSTENGRIGWLPPIAKDGDFICVYDGMELPYAIRPAVDGRYLLVGECIIQGLMMGEAVESSDAVSEIIVLE